MKSRFILAVALLCGIASFGMAVEVSVAIASVDIVNEDSVPHSITIDERNNTIRVFTARGGSIMLPPGQDVAQRARHGVWTIVGDSGREMQVRFHRGRDYKLHLRPYVHGDVSTLVGVMDDGYNHRSVPLADMRRLPHVGDIPQSEYNPSYHGNYEGEQGYQYYRTDSKESLGHAIHQAFNQFLHNIGDQNQGTTQYEQPYGQYDAPQGTTHWAY